MLLHSALWHELVQQHQIFAFVAIAHETYEVFMMNPCKKFNL